VSFVGSAFISVLIERCDVDVDVDGLKKEDWSGDLYVGTNNVNALVVDRQRGAATIAVTITAAA
jgi:hypothetical protein